mgnify:CR=1 FL=1|tara:strand:- start:215 stop:1129 length:915 start_codon:yes stop_codon:yes gene_type:complete
MKFSIILPTYNRASTFLKQAIDSVVSQSYENWELIIIDNNSTDNTDELIKSFHNEKIKTYKIDNHGNIARSRNLGIKKSNGDYIALIDSDDFWEKDKLLHSYKHFKNSKTDGFCHSEYWLYPSGCQEIRHYGPNQNFLYSNLLERGNCLSLSAIVLSKNILIKVGGFSENDSFITAEDYDLWLRLAKINSKMFFSKKIMGTFRIHVDSESRNIMKNTNAVSKVIKAHCIKHNLSNSIRNNSLANCWLIAGKIFQLNNEYKHACKAYFKSLSYSFLSVEALILLFSLTLPHKFFISCREFIRKKI